MGEQALQLFGARWVSRASILSWAMFLDGEDRVLSSAPSSNTLMRWRIFQGEIYLCRLAGLKSGGDLLFRIADLFVLSWPCLRTGWDRGSSFVTSCRAKKEQRKSVDGAGSISVRSMIFPKSSEPTLSQWIEKIGLSWLNPKPTKNSQMVQESVAVDGQIAKERCAQGIQNRLHLPMLISSHLRFTWWKPSCSSRRTRNSLQPFATSFITESMTDPEWSILIRSKRARVDHAAPRNLLWILSLKLN